MALPTRAIAATLSAVTSRLVKNVLVYVRSPLRSVANSTQAPMTASSLSRTGGPFIQRKRCRSTCCSRLRVLIQPLEWMKSSCSSSYMRLWELGLQTNRKSALRSKTSRHRGGQPALGGVALAVLLALFLGLFRRVRRWTLLGLDERRYQRQDEAVAVGDHRRREHRTEALLALVGPDMAGGALRAVDLDAVRGDEQAAAETLERG